MLIAIGFIFIRRKVKDKLKLSVCCQNGEVCHGEWRREICNLALPDLPQIIKQEAFVVNKFDSALDPTIVECLSEIVYPDR